MANDIGPKGERKGFLRWATTPPQSYAFYLIALVLVWLVSFYVGTLRPNKADRLGPPPVSAPR